MSRETKEELSIEDSIVAHLMLDQGIVPLTSDVTIDVNKILSSLDPDEARKMKRKFRKLWRKQSKWLRVNQTTGGVPKVLKTRRKREVYIEFLAKAREILKRSLPQVR